MKQKSKEPAGNLHEVYLSLGSNLGDRQAYLREALRRLRALLGSTLKGVSSVYETEPVGLKEQPDFLNLVAHLGTSLTPSRLFRETKRIEREMGRQIHARWQPRQIDIDILLYDEIIFSSQFLFIPHREMTKRRFVLVALAEIAGSVYHPIEKATVRALLDRCEDDSRVRRTDVELPLP